MCRNIGFILEIVPCVFENNMYSAAVGWSVLYMSVRSFWPIVLFKSAVSLLILGLEDLSIVGSGVLKSPHIMVLLFCSPFSSVSISFFF